jgi:hypothetical protein
MVLYHPHAPMTTGSQPSFSCYRRCPLDDPPQSPLANLTNFAYVLLMNHVRMYSSHAVHAIHHHIHMHRAAMRHPAWAPQHQAALRTVSLCACIILLMLSSSKFLRVSIIKCFTASSDRALFLFLFLFLFARLSEPYLILLHACTKICDDAVCRHMMTNIEYLGLS